ncbi:hypothetical protein Q6348_15255 [Isoptericola sp. b441]|uniref:Uncharacterized protein n=1 Tax=Actinotalea lenta TaxID=3064654 RepID=A0ABT9DCC3_9CELL|nr:hypothetical protein [Isoptericola sp. b441]MDO8108554.1 hypothetical protein [Isoptericola sp. b441]
MAVDPMTREAWHEALAARDREVHALADADAVRAENEALERRLDMLMAELHVQREAVRVRDEMVRDLTVALRERDRRQQAPEPTPPGTLTVHARRVLRAARHPVRSARALARRMRRR